MKTKVELAAEMRDYLVSRSGKALRDKYDQLGGEAVFGPWPVGGLRAKKLTFGGQSLVYNSERGAAFHIKGAIHERWLALGGKWIPETDETTTPDGVGRYNHFQGGCSIYWHPDTGAWGVWGDIRKRWAELGWELGYLGYPTSDEGDIDEGGRANSFQHGWIYWWGDTGAIDLRGIVLSYVGFYAYSESDHDQSSGSDEPYCIFTMVVPKHETWSLRTKVYDGVDDQSARPDRLELYRGPAYGMTLGVVGMEKDMGNPDANLELVQTAVKTNHEVGKFLLQFIPLVGPIISKVAGPALDGLMPKLGAGIASLLDLGDDVVGEVSLPLSTKRLVSLAVRRETYNNKGIVYKFESGMMQKSGARYKAYFTVDPA
ncbi:LGFP repeat-containing protein [Sphingomonas koreensis]